MGRTPAADADPCRASTPGPEADAGPAPGAEARAGRDPGPDADGGRGVGAPGAPGGCRLLVAMALPFSCSGLQDAIAS
ncbi:hypothetical protein ABZX62_34060 [Streptomyces flavidovirens]|uniref:Uncharacterized protein n=1 Tax=Streptomyces flavidovirens TaxID=67298 RepID=A0ABW6RJV7_9ACTN|nr:hypothetical protein [Streptomyces sp. ISL-99]MBT2524004.1 hypothetical protein [Streptomyces sp. ISL-99]